MNPTILINLIGFATMFVGLIGYSCDFTGIDSDIRTLKSMALFYVLLAVEFTLHHLVVSDPTYHMAVHVLLSLTALVIGYELIGSVRRNVFIGSRFKELIVYGAIVWLASDRIHTAEFDVYFVLIVTSMIIAVLLGYMFYSVRRMMTFFVIEKELILSMFVIIFLIGESTATLTLLPLIVATFVMVFVTYKVVETAKPFLLR